VMAASQGLGRGARAVGSLMGEGFDAAPGQKASFAQFGHGC